MKNQLWTELLTPTALKAGWNLVRTDAKADFLDCPWYSDVFTVAYEQNISEILRRLATGSYRPSPLTHIDIPKSTLATRPGTVAQIEDRIILTSIVRLLAPLADKRLPDAVYSYRLKQPPTPTVLFKESDVLDLPYLKSNTISKLIDPFDPWYAAWPEFDELSRAAFLKDGYGFLAVSDIAAYFENIQLPILRDVLLNIFPEDQIIINLLVDFLEAWTPKTDQRRNIHRGIPQGNQVSSFLGNIFLLPVDETLKHFCNECDARYFRYMDDIRLFAKDYATTQRGLLVLDKAIRSLHLNTQSAKTEILAESPNKEITRRLIDTRLDEINFVIDKIKEKPKLTKEEKSLLFERLRKVAHKKPFSELETKLIGSHRPLKGLTLRVFRRWLTAQGMLGGTEYVKHLVKEIKRTPDHRLTRRLLFVSRNVPKLHKHADGLLKYISSDPNVPPHQQAEILWGFRYVSKIPADIIAICSKLILVKTAHFYVRSEAALLLSRVKLDKKLVDACRTEFNATLDTHLQIALASILMQSSAKFADSTLQLILFHPNDQVRKVGFLLHQVRYDVGTAKRKLKFLFSHPNDWPLCDNMALLFSMCCSDRPEILHALISYLRKPAKQSPRLHLRETLKYISQRATLQLANVSKRAP